ncbi:MAG: transposase [Planctomycetes bacterium]|nr:transposase [Planctomycetota bacterium]
MPGDRRVAEADERGRSGAAERPVRAQGRRGHALTLSIQKASPWENGCVESFNGRPHDDLLDRKLFLSLPEARVVLDQWRMDYNHRRPHGGLKWLTRGVRCRAGRYGLRGGPGGVVWCVSGRGYAPPSDTPRELFPTFS